MEDVEDKPPPETSVIMAEQKPLVETPEENSEVMMAGTGFPTEFSDLEVSLNASNDKTIAQVEHLPTGDSASTPEATIHGTEETHQEEDIFNRQKEGVSAVTASSDVDNNLMNPSTSSSETKELQSGSIELITDSPQTMVADVAEDNSASTSKGSVHETEQSNQGAMPANSEAGKLEDMSNRQQDGSDADNQMEPSTSSFKEKELQNVPQTVDTDVVEEAVGSHSVAAGNDDVDNSSEKIELLNDHKELKIELPQTEVEAVEPPAASDEMASSSEQVELQNDEEEQKTDPSQDNVTDVALRGDDSPSASDDSEMKLLQDDQKEQKTDPSQTSITDTTVGATDSPSFVRQMTVRRTLIDTAAPFESVKEAVSKFGGIVDWKAHRIQTVERRKHVEHEHEKAQQLIPECRKKAEAAEKEKMRVLQELDTTKRLIEELKLNLERAQTEERQARQDSELAKLRVEEMEQGIADDSSVAAKAQLEVARARYSSAVTELTSIKEELDALRGEYASLVVEKEEAVKKSEEAIASSKQVEKTVEDLTIELIATKEALESAHAAHMEAEEQRIGTVMAKDQDCLLWETELNQAEEEVQSLNQKILSAKDLKSKLQAASALLLNLKAELSLYMESKPDPEGGDEGVSKEGQDKPAKKTHSEIQEAVASAKKELEEVKLNIEKATTEVNYLKVAVASLKTELENEKLSFASMRQREGMASIAAASLEGELENTVSETALVQMKEKEAREKIAVLPKKLQEAVEENNEAKLLAQEAREELQRVEEEAEQLKASASTLQSKLLAAEMEIEAARASERLAIAAGKALQESESPKSSKTEVDSSNWVTLSVEEYYNLSKQAHDAEKEANMRVATANSRIEAAKESELRTLEKLNGVTREMAARRESLKMAMEKAEKAREGKLGVEQELRKWRADHEQRRKAGSAVGKELVKHQSSKSSDGILERHKTHRLPMPLRYFSSSKSYVHSNGGAAVSSPDSKSGKKKKKSFFPWVLMFFGKKKSHTTHSG
ncbi:protein WEAK CHLOROPLAST MOVEMENT UNDER BLUE LIGHT 1-like isoform X2 [Vigna unguiculata]|uniref:WEB family n=2 Tax=Vigna unguiculata TaxID=3917 RepID=A0A4D6MDT9_VIGUN|nr:protein WEAK CHLOROPLAST MOVEMENT UNDER BLUE LIGHT 1-like isoform X2 [Vigna unguiculata]XP_027940318.1 protein WEAK CHLOROPLAST MOVEMENT UNDER BLUE LIGHT 1-like isoform X2 [Vigna unguiculata]QCD98963.1 WEB family [Vigna unguiculata]